jgi:hypothetical protein
MGILQHSPANQVSFNVVPMEKTQVRSTKRELRQKRRELTINSTKSAELKMEDLNIALLSVKPGKAACFDGVYPEFIKNAGLRTNQWILCKTVEVIEQ